MPRRAITEDQESYISPRYLPSRSLLKDPSKLQNTEATDLLQFWYGRQEANKVPTFKFKAWRNHAGEIVDPVDTGEVTSEDDLPVQGSRRAGFEGARHIGQANSHESEDDSVTGNDHTASSGCDSVTSTSNRTKGKKRTGAVLVRDDNIEMPARHSRDVVNKEVVGRKRARTAEASAMSPRMTRSRTSRK